MIIGSWRPHKNGSVCPRCESGKIHEIEGMQLCSYCGRVFWVSRDSISFYLLPKGEKFISIGDEQKRVYVKGKPPEIRWVFRANSYEEKTGLPAFYGPIARVRSVHNRLQADAFSYS